MLFIDFYPLFVQKFHISLNILDCGRKPDQLEKTYACYCFNQLVVGVFQHSDNALTVTGDQPQSFSCELVLIVMVKCQWINFVKVRTYCKPHRVVSTVSGFESCSLWSIWDSKLPLGVRVKGMCVCVPCDGLETCLSCIPCLPVLQAPAGPCKTVMVHSR